MKKLRNVFNCLKTKYIEVVIKKFVAKIIFIREKMSNTKVSGIFLLQSHLLN